MKTDQFSLQDGFGRIHRCDFRRRHHRNSNCQLACFCASFCSWSYWRQWDESPLFQCIFVWLYLRNLPWNIQAITHPGLGRSQKILTGGQSLCKQFYWEGSISLSTAPEYGQFGHSMQNLLFGGRELVMVIPIEDSNTSRNHWLLSLNI